MLAFGSGSEGEGFQDLEGAGGRWSLMVQMRRCVSSIKAKSWEYEHDMKVIVKHNIYVNPCIV